MSLTKVTSIVLDDDIQVKTINGAEISIIAKPNAIPKATESGQLDPSWGTGGGGGTGGTGGGGDMFKITYDTNSNGKVDVAEKAESLTPHGSKNNLWGINASNVQGWIDPDTILLTKAKYDKTNTGNKVDHAIVADKLAGNPQANKLWGTDNAGVQGWIDTLNGDMSKTIYDKNSDGIVDKAEIAYGIANPMPNRVWGTSEHGVQSWLSFNLSDVMLKSRYDDGVINADKVSLAKAADKLSSEDDANNNTVYMKDADGVVKWNSLSAIVSGAMLQNDYGYVDDGSQVIGKVKHAAVADDLVANASATNGTFYCKNNTGQLGFWPIENFPNVMLASEFETPATATKIVKEATTATTLHIFNDAIADTAFPSGVLGVLNNGPIRFRRLEEFIDENSAIKSNWCGLSFTISGKHNELGKIDRNEPIYTNNTKIDIYQLNSQNGTYELTQIEPLTRFLNCIQFNPDENIFYTNKKVWMKIYFHSYDENIKAQLLTGSYDNPGNINKISSLITSEYASQPILFEVNDAFSIKIYHANDIDRINQLKLCIELV